MLSIVLPIHPLFFLLSLFSRNQTWMPKNQRRPIITTTVIDFYSQQSFWRSSTSSNRLHFDIPTQWTTVYLIYAMLAVGSRHGDSAVRISVFASNKMGADTRLGACVLKRYHHKNIFYGARCRSGLHKFSFWTR